MRTACLRCRRPESACYCDAIPKLDSRTRVVFLQHPRERRVAIGTARMAHLALANSELHWGVRFDDDPRIRALVESGEAALLFPGEGAHSPESMPGLRNLVVIDGTWPQAKKMLKTSPLLQRLPRLGFSPRRPGAYRIRREPAAHCLSTVEAVAEVLGKLEGDVPRFDSMLTAFEKMVDHQIACTAAREGPPRRRIHRGPPAVRIPEELATRAANLTLVYAEANVPPHGLRNTETHELIHWVSERPSTGERFEAVLRPRGELYPSTPFHLSLPPARFVDGEPVEDAMARFHAFVRPDDILVSWGGYVFSLLKAAGFRPREAMDLRIICADALRRRPGALETLATEWGSPRAVWAQGRAGSRLSAMASILVRLQDRLMGSAEVASL